MGTSVVRAQLAPGITVDSDTFTDITTATLVEAAWENDGYLRAVFDRDLTDTELPAVIRKMVLTEGVKTRIAQKSVVQSAPPVGLGVVNDVVRVEVNGVIAEEYVADENGEWNVTPSATVATALSGQRVVIDLDGLRAYNAANQIVTTIMASNGRIVSSSALFASTGPASTAPGNVPALRIGAPAGRHLRADGNDLIAMDSDGVQGQLFLNNGGLTRVTDLNILGRVQSPVRFNNAVEGEGALTLRAATGTTITGELQVAGGSNIRGKIRNTGQPDAGGVSIVFLDTRVGICTAGMNASDFTAGNTQSLVFNQGTAFNGLFDNSSTGGGDLTAEFTAGGRLQRQRSSKRYKQNWSPIPLDVARRVLVPQGVQFRKRADVQLFGDDAVFYPGYLAEDLHDAGLGLWVVYDDQGRPDAVRYAELIAPALAVLRDHENRITRLEETT